MSKKFSIHEWQAKQRLAEQDDPSLDEYGSMRLPTYRSRASSFSVGGSKQYDSPGGEGKMAKGDVIELAKDAEDVVEMIGPESNLPEWVEAKITKAAEYINTVKDYLSNYDASREEIDEVNTLAGAGSGASVSAGPGFGYMTPNAFKKKRKKVNEQEKDVEDKESENDTEDSGKEISKDVEMMLKQVSRINTKDEFIELFKAIMDLEVRGMSDSMKATLLRNTIKTL